MRKKILITSSIFLIIFFILVLRPISVTRQNSKDIQGIVFVIYEAGDKDAVIELEDNKYNYYINRGLDKTFTLEDLKQKLVGKEVTISYAKHWTPLDPFNTGSRHIVELKIGQEIIFTEIQK